MQFRCNLARLTGSARVRRVLGHVPRDLQRRAFTPLCLGDRIRRVGGSNPPFPTSQEAPLEFTEILRRRRMVRRYRAEPVSVTQIERIVGTALRAPSAGFSQGQSFVIVTDRATRRRIAELAGESGYLARGFEPWISEAPAVLVVSTSEEAYRERYREPDKLGPDGKLGRDIPYWYVDAGCSMMLALLAAVEEGLAAGFLGAHRLGGLRELLGIPQEVCPIGLITIGKPASDRRSSSIARGRRPQAEVVHWERWGAKCPARHRRSDHL
ncbi:MAG: nitroreductase family protein [Candidatus Methylomirabilales bacterium]